MSQNRSSAVMAQRSEAPDSLDFYPTPAWGTRALFHYVIGYPFPSCWEPACGEGHMARVLGEYFGVVWATDIHNYGGTAVADFLYSSERPGGAIPDWIITNPPFNKAEEFVRRARAIARVGVAMLCRSTWLESERRNALFTEHPLSIYAPFIGRLPMFKGRLDRKGSTATAYAWFVWIKNYGPETRMIRIPPDAKKQLDRDEDWL